MTSARHGELGASTPTYRFNCDVQLTLMASSLYRLTGRRIGHGYETAKSSHLFRDLVRATAQITIDPTQVTVHLHRRAHDPLLMAAGFRDTDIAIPCLSGKRLPLALGS